MILIFSVVVLLSMFLIGIYTKNKILMYLTMGASVFVIGYCIYKIFFVKEHFSFSFTDDQKYVSEGKTDIYCGDDLLLPDYYDDFGTRHKCLKKGMGIGMGMSDASIAKIIAKPPKEQTERTYCGNSTTLPQGYNRFASLHECLKKGVGVGVRMPEEKRRQFKWKSPKRMNKHEIYELAHRFKIPTNQTRKNVLEQISREIIESN